MVELRPTLELPLRLIELELVGHRQFLQEHAVVVPLMCEQRALTEQAPLVEFLYLRILRVERRQLVIF